MSLRSIQIKFRTGLFIAAFAFISNTAGACCVSDDRNLAEMLMQDKWLTVFRCKILSSYTDSNFNYLSKALLVEVYFGEVKNKYITLNTGSPMSSTKGWQLAAGSEMVIYSSGSGPSFSCGGICDHLTHPFENNAAGKSEIETLKLFAKIYAKKKSGMFKFYTGNHIVLSEGHFKDGVAVGDWKHYNPDGKIKQRVNLETKDAIYYNANGKITQENITSADTTIYISYINKEKNLLKMKSVTFPLGKSIYLTYFYDYYPNGKTRSISGSAYLKEGNGTAGKGKEGTYEEYYENGNVRLKGQHTNNRRTGLWVWYEENGNEQARFDYKDGMDNQ